MPVCLSACWQFVSWLGWDWSRTRPCADMLQAGDTHILGHSAVTQSISEDVSVYVEVTVCSIRRHTIYQYWYIFMLHSFHFLSFMSSEVVKFQIKRNGTLILYTHLKLWCSIMSWHCPSIGLSSLLFAGNSLSFFVTRETRLYTHIIHTWDCIWGQKVEVTVGHCVYFVFYLFID